jgi:hypothetical protein
MMYVKLLGFVYVYYFIVTAFAMFIFSIFIFLTRTHIRTLFKNIAIGARVFLGVFLISLTAITVDFDLTYSFMTCPMILFTFTLTLFTGESCSCYSEIWQRPDLIVVLLVDRLLDWLDMRSREATPAVEEIDRASTPGAVEQMDSATTRGSLVLPSEQL